MKRAAERVAVADLFSAVPHNLTPDPSNGFQIIITFFKQDGWRRSMTTIAVIGDVPAGPRPHAGSGGGTSASYCERVNATMAYA
jgi:hypothetical protein